MIRTSSTPIRRPLRAYLLWLVLATLLPGVVGALALFVHQYQKSRAQFERNTMQTVRALVQTVESRLLQGQAVAQTLSTVDALENEDFARVHAQAREALSLAGGGANAVLRDRSGQQLLNTAVDYGIALPADRASQLVEVFATGRPSVSAVFTGALQRQPMTSVDVPVPGHGKATYVLSIGLTPAYFKDVLSSKSVPEGVLASLFDQQGIIFGRNVQSERFVGLRITDTLDRAMQRAPEGVIEAVTRDGTEVLTFYSRSARTGWGVAVGVPRSALNQALFQPLLGERARKLAAKESELRESHLLARFGTWHRDLASGAVQTSDSMSAIYGREVPPLEQQRGTVLPEESWQQLDELARRLQREGGSGRLQVLVNHAAGHQIWIDLRCDSIQDADGRVTALRGTI